MSFSAIQIAPLVQAISWGPLATAVTGDAFERPDFPDRSIQVTGTFGAGGSLIVEGSNNGTIWHTLTDVHSTALTFTTAGLRQVAEITRFIRPRVSGGDGTTALTVSMLVKV